MNPGSGYYLCVCAELYGLFVKSENIPGFNGVGRRAAGICHAWNLTGGDNVLMEKK